MTTLLGEHTINVLEIAMANKKAAAELTMAIESGGGGSGDAFWQLMSH